MFNSTSYLRLLGLPEADAQLSGSKIKNWSELTDWLDQNQAAPIQPKPNRISIIPPTLNTSWKSNLWRLFRSEKSAGRPVGVAPGWERIVEYRRRVSLALTLATTAIILLLSNVTLQAQKMPEITLNLYLVIYGIMTFFLVSNFCKLVLGTWHTLRGSANNPWHPSKTACDPRPKTKVAIVFPVYHEDVARMAAGLAATWNSIQETHPLLAHHFDCFLLSDSRKPEYWIAEQAAVHALMAGFPGGRFFYRRRASNLNAKMGNLVDFCRRWGENYDYMLVMDADSVMDGDAIIALLRMMEGNHRIGILQTNPKPILRKSLFGRMQQFSGRLYGAVFSYSLQAMYMGHACYIGHNALIRMKPFIAHCILPELSGKAPWGGKPLSHDIVESAMMARAGYEVWFLPEIEGSYEEVPANILGFLVRERRWMQGNLQHLRLLFVGGFRAIHRETFLTGSMGYVSAPLWACFLLISAYGMVHFLGTGILSIGNLKSLELPMSMLLVSSMVFLFMPRLLALAVYLEAGKARQFGGKDKLILSLLLETTFSFFFSPIIMILVTRFIWLWVKRRSISWGTQQRDDAPLPWSDCLRHFGWVSVFGVLCWSAMGYQLTNITTTQTMLLQTFSANWIHPDDMMLWFFPILGGFAFSVWIARFTSLTYPGIEKRMLFSTPEELNPPEVVSDTLFWEAKLRSMLPSLETPKAAIAFALTNQHFYINHRPATRYRARIAATLLPKIKTGQRLTARELILAIGERDCFDALHSLNSEV